jgi:hypothetical protein
MATGEVRFTIKAASKLNIAYIQFFRINQYLVGEYIIVQNSWAPSLRGL